MFEPRYDEPYTRSIPVGGRLHERGGRDPDINVGSPDASPLSRNALQICPSRNACLLGKGLRHLERLMLQNTYLEYELSVASVPFCDDGQV